MHEDVLVAWSVGPVPTKHLISLIKKNLGMIHSEQWGLGSRAKSALTSPLPHTYRLPLATAPCGIKEKKVLKQILGKFSRHSDLRSSKNKAGN